MAEIWGTLVGAAVSAGTGLYAANQQSKAGEKQAQALQSGTRELEPVLLGDPEKIDTRKVNLRTIDEIYDYIPYARRLSDNINSYNYSRAVQYYRRIQPFFDKLQKQIGSNALSFAKGEIPQDVSAEIQRQAAEKGIRGGFALGSTGAKTGAPANLMLRNLGLTSLDLSKFGTNLGMQANAAAKNLMPQLMSPLELFLGPQQQLSAEQFNVGAGNTFALRNNELLNNAALQNTSTANAVNESAAVARYNSDVKNAMWMNELGKSVGGSINSLGSSVGSRTANRDLSNWTPTEAQSYGLNTWDDLRAMGLS